MSRQMEGGVVMDISCAGLRHVIRGPMQWLSGQGQLLTDDEREEAITNDSDEVLSLLLEHEVSPGVTLGDAVRAYLALERMGVVHDVAVSRSLKDPASWTCDWADDKFVDFGRDALRPSLAAAILAAAEVE